MWIKTACGLVLAALLAQPATAQAPLSAIDWLSDSLANSTPGGRRLDGDVVSNALPGSVLVSEISGPTPDSVGLLPGRMTGLPRNLWGPSLTGDLAGRMLVDEQDMLPAMLDLQYTLLLAETDPPADTNQAARLFLARLDALLALGAVEQAQALLNLSGLNQREIFRRAFDVSLLLRVEDKTCETLRSVPAMSPTFPARIFCLTRGGDWDAAALSLETGRALGFVSDEDDALLARFLAPAMFEGEPPLAMPTRPSPLVFRLFEAIGEPIPTTGLPRAFAHADLHANTGWKAQIEAAERLVRSGAVDPNRLLGLYSERRAAASGGVWDRVRAIQALTHALERKDRENVARVLPAVWREMARAELEVPFAKLFAAQITALSLTGDAGALAFKIGLLSGDYETVAIDFTAVTDRQRLLQAIAQGKPGAQDENDPLARALQAGFRANGVPTRLQTLMTQDRLGQAILRAIVLFTNGAQGDLDKLTDAIAFFRAVGLEDSARRASLQLLLLERRG